jgi:phosphate-selective porin OprO/OprP
LALAGAALVACAAAQAQTPDVPPMRPPTAVPAPSRPWLVAPEGVGLAVPTTNVPQQDRPDSSASDVASPIFMTTEASEAALLGEEGLLEAPSEAPSNLTSDFAKRLAEVEKRLNAQDAAAKKSAESAKTKKKDEAPKADDPRKKKFVTRPFGRIHIDTASFDQNEANRATVGNALNGVDIRRARLGIEGEGYDRFFYRLDADFVTFDSELATRPVIFDAYLDVQKLPALGNLRIGHFREPFSLQRLDSSHDFAFMERTAAINSLAPFRNIGMMVFDWNEAETCTWASGFFAENTNEYGEELGDRTGVSLTSRVTLLPWYEECGGDLFLFHVGASHSYRRLGTFQRRFSQTPEVQLKEGATVRTPNFIDTGILLLDEYHVAGVEAVAVLGGWSFQSEYICVAGEQLNGQDLFLQGAYFETTYWLTGEHRNYLRRLGIFGAVTPLCPFVCLDDCCRHNGRGAWEAKARVSWADFDDNLIQGGEMTIFSAGFNWYYTVRSRIMFDYVHPLLDRAGIDSAANIFAMRFQVAF